MEKEILDGIRKEIEELRARIDALSARLDGIGSAGEDMSFAEPVSLDDIDTPAIAAVEPAVQETSVAAVETPAPVEAPVSAEPEPETAVPELPEYKWCKDECGARISNVISGIPLNDRLLIINCLFGEDPMAFQKAITDINALGSFAEAVGYVMKNHSGWQMSSSPVYTLMMAVRRRFK